MISLPARYMGLVKISIRERMRYRFDFFMTLVSTLLFSMLFYTVWRAVYAYSESYVMPWPQLLTYVMVGQAVNFARWSPAERGAVYGTASRIRSGDVAGDLIRPVDFQMRRFLEALGFFAVEMLWINLPCLLLFIAFLGVKPPGDLFAAIGFAVSLLIAFTVAFSLNSIVMMISFWTTNAQGVQTAKKAVVDILAGTLIPYEFFPEWLRSIVLHLPFQGIAYIPLSIYTGKITGPAVCWSLLEQVAWAVLMFAVSRLLWSKASKQITIYGG